MIFKGDSENSLLLVLMSSQESDPCMAYIPESLTVADETALQAGDEVTKTAMLGGTSEFGISQTMPVKLRQCAGMNHVYLQKPLLPFSAYCVGTCHVLLT